MIMEVKFRDDSYIKDVLDDLIAIEAPENGAFYPVSHSILLKKAEYPNLWGWAIPLEQCDAFETLYMEYKDSEVAQEFGNRFMLCKWIDADAYSANLLPAPAYQDRPLTGHNGENATWACFSSYGWESHRFDLFCDLVAGKCKVSIRDAEKYHEIAFKIAPSKLTNLATMNQDANYGQHLKRDPFEIYDGDHWEYALGTDSTVLIRGYRRYYGESSEDPIRQLFLKIRHSGIVEMRRNWGFVI